MAEYVYKCQICGKEFIVSVSMLHKISDVHCPDCRSWQVVKKFQPFGIVFKGKGFYSTDNRKNK